MLWPETVIFWGAGATASLGFPTTFQMGECIHNLVNKQECKTLDGIHKELSIFLDAVDSQNPTEITDDQIKKVRSLYEGGSLPDKKEPLLIAEWRRHYDWFALKRIAEKIMPDEENTDFASYFNYLYNIIDESLDYQTGVSVEYEGRPLVLSGSRLKNARTLLDALQLWMISCAYHNALKNKKDIVEKYISFVGILGDLMREEGRFLNNLDNINFDSREFYLFSYALVSMNYEPLLLWLLFNAHKNLNEQESLCVTSRNRYLKLFNDFSLFFGMKPIKKKDGNEPEFQIWYPMNEPAAQRINSYDEANRIMRIGKFYYPHGSLTFRKCPNCGKLNIKFGNKWEYLSESLFFNFPFPTELNKNNIEDNETGQCDAFKCLFCGEMTYTYDLAYVTQSSFKQKPPSFLAEMQDDMKVCVENCKHIVLMGYGLPPDDVFWRSVMMAKGKGSTFCTVVDKFKCDKQWIYGKELRKCKSRAVESVVSIFGENNVRAFSGGIPEVWEGGKEAVKKLLYPSEFFSVEFPYFLKKRIKTDKKI